MKLPKKSRLHQWFLDGEISPPRKEIEMWDIEFYGGKFILCIKDIMGVPRLEIIKCIEEQYL